MIRTPVPIRISASISDLGPGVLGGAGPNGWFEVPSGDPGVIYPQALANAMSGYDVDPSSPDISAVFDDDAAGAGWYLGTDGNPPSNQYDFESTVMHEIGHGLGFYATADSDVTGCPQSTGCFGLNAAGGDTQPSEFDTHLSRGLGGARLLVNQGGRAWASALAPNMTGALLSVFQSQSIYYRGLFTDLAAGATPARLYAPSSWVPASSISHLDEATYPAGSVEALMTPAMERGESSHAPGPITLGIMADLGWHVPSVVDAPNTAFIRAGMVDFLDRLPTASEEAQYRDDLGRHALSRYAFVNLLAKSPEWITARVNDLYVSTLHRPADSAGLTYWSTLVSQGRLTIAQLAATLYASDESFQVSGHRDVDTWIGFLYSDLLGRQPDPAGLSYWAAVTQAQGRQATAIALYQSAESRSRRVDGLYSTLLGRGADSGGRSFWTNYLSNGDDVTLAAQLAASDEYFLRSMSRGL